MTFRNALLAAAVIAGPIAGAVPAAATLSENFDSVASGTQTQFTDNGMIFSSPSDPGAFYVGPTGGLYNLLTGNALFSSSFTGATLDVTFSEPETSVTLDFAIDDIFAAIGDDTLSYLTNTGATGTATGTLPPGVSYPEGVLTYAGAPITSIAITSATEGFVVDNVAAPEPASLGLLVVGVLGLAARRRRA